METVKRNSAIEVLRITSMLMIIMHHYTLYGVMQSYSADLACLIYSSGNTANKIVANMMLPGGVVGVAIFFIIAGYFGISTDSLKIDSLKNIIYSVFTYSVLGTIIWCVLIYNSILPASNSIKKSIINGLLPLSNNLYWFASTYVIIMLMKPVLNAFIRRLSFKTIVLLICSSMICYGLLRVSLAHYLGLWNGLVFYILGAVLKEYKDGIGKMPEIFYLILGIIGWVGYSVCNILGFGLLGNLIAVCIMGTISAFGFSAFFIKKEQFYNDKINNIAALTFGVYLFHEHPQLREILWEKIFHVARFQYQSNLFSLYALCTILLVFIVGCTVEALRRRFEHLIKLLLM